MGFEKDMYIQLSQCVFERRTMDKPAGEELAYTYVDRIIDCDLSIKLHSLQCTVLPLGDEMKISPATSSLNEARALPKPSRSYPMFFPAEVQVPLLQQVGVA